MGCKLTPLVFFSLTWKTEMMIIGSFKGFERNVAFEVSGEGKRVISMS